MKKPLLLFIFFRLFIFNSQGQNLVLNGDFEQYTGCPNGVAQIDSALFWTNPAMLSTGGTPDYFNQCNSPLIVGVPDNGFGHQYAHSGNAYAGAMLWILGSPDFREYPEGTLITPLTANQCYHFEMYISLAENYGGYTTDDIAVYFSDTLIHNYPNAYAMPFIPQINNATGNFPDTLNWSLVSGSFIAAGGERYLLIGNFKNNATTDTIFYNPNSFTYIYVYIDDVSLTTCTAIEEQNQNDAIKIYPNPVKDLLNIQCSMFNVQNKKSEIKITDILGKEIYRNQFSDSNIKFPVSNFQSGIYFIEINDACLPDRQGKNIFRKKFLKE